MSISSEITRLQNAKASIKTSIENKGVTVPSATKLDGYSALIDTIQTGSQVTVESLTVTQNGTYQESGKAYSPVVVNVPTDVEEAEIKDVNFFDYDGTCVYSYTAEEFADVTELPPLPYHEELIDGRWKWTLEDIKTQLEDVGGKVYVESYYDIEGGGARFYFEFDDDVSPYFGFCVNGSIEIDWGDGSEKTTVTGTSLTSNISAHHSYNKGSYVLTVTPSANSKFSITGNNKSSSLITSSAGDNNDTYSVQYLTCLKKANIGSSFSFSNNFAFNRLTKLEKISIAKTATFSTMGFVFQNCPLLKTASMPWFAGYTFYYNVRMEYLSVTFGNNISANLLNGCEFVKDITIKKGATGINNAAFSGNKSLREIYVPDTVASIGTTAFANCYAMREYHFRRTTPPSLAGTSAFSNINSVCKIYVPYSEDHSILEAYKTATNWSTYASYIQEEPQ